MIQKHNVYDTDGWNLILFFGFYDTACPKVLSKVILTSESQIKLHLYLGLCLYDDGIDKKV